MSTKKTRNQHRDTAKDIILGLEPSGQGPRQPKEGIANYPAKTEKPKVIIDRRPDSSALRQLQHQLDEVKRQNRDLLQAEQAAIRRLEANLNSLQSKLLATDKELKARDYDDLRRQISSVDGKMASLNSDISCLRSTLDRQKSDLMHINNDLKTKDLSKIVSAVQQVDNKVRDLHSQIRLFKQNVDMERQNRIKEENSLSDRLQGVQDLIKQQDVMKNEILNSLKRKAESDKVCITTHFLLLSAVELSFLIIFSEKLSEEISRLSEKVAEINTDLTRNIADVQQKLSDNLNQKFAPLETLQAQFDQNANAIREMRNIIDEKFSTHEGRIESFNEELLAEREKQNDQFQKVNDILAALEHQRQLDDSKIDTIINSEIQTIKLNEKNLLSRINDVENRVNSYFGSLTKSIEEVKSGQENVTIPSLDVDALRREMEAIAADKNKLSMEGLLKLEERMTHIHAGLLRSHKEVSQQIANFDESDNDVRELKKQLNRFGTLVEDMEKVHDRIRDKVEKQIPKDLNELSAKTDNIMQQLNSRLDKEEEERFFAIKELQETFQKLQNRGALLTRNDPIEGGGSTNIRHDIDEYKIAIRKLAEAVTTVKNVLEKKITDQSRKIEAVINRLSRSMNS